MKINFHINYFTQFGENMFVIVNGTECKMQYGENGCWFLRDFEATGKQISYFYLLKNNLNEEIAREWGNVKKVSLIKTFETYNIYDFWAEINNQKSFYSSAFTKVVNKRAVKKIKQKTYKRNIEFTVWAPQVEPNLLLAVTGSDNTLGNWRKPVILVDNEFPIWKIDFDASEFDNYCEFKFVTINAQTGEIKSWEAGENRKINLNESENNVNNVYCFETSIGYENTWRGAGTAIPVFSLRTKNSFGIGDFLDLKKMTDWVKYTNQIMLQTLPINDTCMYFDQRDSYPYNANSIYALHPIYINPKAMGKLPAEKKHEYEKMQKELNSLSVVDYNKVIASKWQFFKYFFEQDGRETLKTDRFEKFFEKNEFWLKPYAAFCVLRDKFKTPDFTKWTGFEIYKNIEHSTFEKLNSEAFNFYYFLQYHADKQMSEVSRYARNKGIILKGDVPIGISRKSVEAWTEPDYFNMNSQAGAPPDDFSVDGQNWGFFTYNWDEMKKDGYKWWILRLKKMADYFDAYRIDHILGFFRIWEIPLDSVQGLLGYFNPSLPYSCAELEKYNLPMNKERFLKPYVRQHFLGEIFGKYDYFARENFFNQTTEDILELKPEFDTQRKVERFFENKTDEKSEILRKGLYTLINNVLFVEDPVKKNHFYPRITAQLSISYRELDDFGKNAFDALYDDFYYNRNAEYWKHFAMEKLPALIRATEMLVCGEDLGMIPDCVPLVMKNLQILSLEIQRMPKNQGIDFGNPADYPYLSVCTTSTHDMSTLRGWWKENFETTQKFYNDMLHKSGQAPKLCSAQIVEEILKKHLQSPAMLAVFPLQEWLGIDEKIRRKNEDEERINVPSNPNNYWQYRMHITIEQMMENEEFNSKIAKLAKRN